MSLASLDGMCHRYHQLDISFWIDQANSILKVKMKYPDGTVKGGDVATLA